MTAISHAMILAAGLGKRMQPLTDELPKPLVKVGDRCLLDRAIDVVADAGIDHIVVNVHHLAVQVEQHIARRNSPPHIVISDERAQLLETGGGVKKALPWLQGDAFAVMNADNAWRYEGPSPLTTLLDDWQPEAMDILLLVVPHQRAIGFEGAGDFFRAIDGSLRRRGTEISAPFIFTGVQIIARNMFADTPGGAFSLGLLYDRAIARGRIASLVYEGDWFHVGTPGAVVATEAVLAGFSPP